MGKKSVIKCYYDVAVHNNKVIFLGSDFHTIMERANAQKVFHHSGNIRLISPASNENFIKHTNDTIKHVDYADLDIHDYTPTLADIVQS